MIKRRAKIRKRNLPSTSHRLRVKIRIDEEKDD